MKKYFIILSTLITCLFSAQVKANLDYEIDYTITYAPRNNIFPGQGHINLSDGILNTGTTSFSAYSSGNGGPAAYFYDPNNSFISIGATYGVSASNPMSVPRFLYVNDYLSFAVDNFGNLLYADIAINDYQNDFDVTLSNEIITGTLMSDNVNICGVPACIVSGTYLSLTQVPGKSSITQVPEPSSLALLFVSVFGVGWTTIRRREA